MRLWVTLGSTESGDALQPLVWDSEPNKEEIEATLRDMYPEEYGEIGYVLHTTTEAVKMWL